MSTSHKTAVGDDKLDACETQIVDWLKGRIENLMEQIKEEPFWMVVTDPATADGLVQEIMKEVYLEIVGYQPFVIEAAIASIGQMPRTMKPNMIRSMLYHQADEWDHGEMALRDYVNMGGDENYARSLPMSPQSFAVAGVWWMITRLRSPYAYLGALYLFEGLTPLITGLVKGNLKNKGMAEDQLEYIEFHSTEDIKHARMVDNMIAETIRNFPESLDTMKLGYEYFEAVYPIPVWRAAYERAVANYGLTAN